MTKNRSIKVSQEFSEAVERYAAERSINWTRALVELASAGLGIEALQAPKHGGERRKNNGPA